MELVYNLIYRGFDLIRRWVGLILPLFSEAADFRNWPRWLKAFMHILVLTMILIGLYYLNDNPWVQRNLKTRAGTTLQQIYLPLLFIVLYVLSWLGYWLYKLLSQEEAHRVQFEGFLKEYRKKS
jgi:hypothetical protein